MEENASLQTVDVQRIRSMVPMAENFAMGNDLLIGEVKSEQLEKTEQLLSFLKYPLRFDGFVIFFLLRGRLRLDLNLTSYELQERSLLVSTPGKIVRLSPADDGSWGEIRLYFLLVSHSFMSEIRFDFNKVLQESILILDEPCIILSEQERSLAQDFFQLAGNILETYLPNKREMISSLLTSFLYLVVDLWSRRVDMPRQLDGKSSSRLKKVVEQFLSLVTEYHTQERGMAFYADKMCLTPKYLSKLVKQTTGRSAPDWIDAFVILEAKNLLKYSDKTIKEIVYALHFPNQSVFYKFFKAHTGLTPSEYRKA